MRIILVSIIFLISCQTLTPEEQFDQESGQQPVLNTAEIDHILNSFDQITYADLPRDYITYTHSNEKFTPQLKKATYYVLQGKDVYRYIVGNYRISDFLSTDLYFTRNRDNLKENYRQYWLTDKKMLYMLLEFILELEQLDYNVSGFTIRESHRHPRFNKARGGADRSQHIYGKAVDLVIEDINKDGNINQQDKTVALEILEKIVGNKGGIGRYPGTMTIHIDSRGYRARWDQQ